jgi:quinohemoprotein ethanol dehydrogenase
MSAAVHATFNDIVLRGQRRPLGMPQWDDVLSEADSNAMHAHLIAIAWDAYRKEQAGVRTEAAPVASK